MSAAPTGPVRSSRLTASHVLGVFLVAGLGALDVAIFARYGGESEGPALLVLPALLPMAPFAAIGLLWRLSPGAAGLLGALVAVAAIAIVGLSGLTASFLIFAVLLSACGALYFQAARVLADPARDTRSRAIAAALMVLALPSLSLLFFNAVFALPCYIEGQCLA